MATAFSTRASTFSGRQALRVESVRSRTARVARSAIQPKAAISHPAEKKFWDEECAAKDDECQTKFWEDKCAAGDNACQAQYWIDSWKATRSLEVSGSRGNFFVGGNWKCNGTLASVDELIAGLNAATLFPNVDVVCGAPFVHLPRVQATLSDNFKPAAQNAWTGAGGAYTGEVSADMLVDLGLEWVILGHSERRELCGETDEVVATKTAYALEKGLKVILCIGETLDEREAGQTLNVCRRQLAAVAKIIDDWTDVVIAYEPVWAIGTGKSATPEDAQQVHAGIRDYLVEAAGAAAATTTRILYGGSVKPATAPELAGKDDIDGFLVGGASLKASDFIQICNAAAVCTIDTAHQ